MSFKKTWAIFFAIAVLFSSLIPLATKMLDAATLTAATVNDEAVVIIDAGHGGIDGGATGVNGVLEKDLNLKIAKQIAAYLRLLGMKVIETRTQDISLASPDATHGHVKQSDLENRVKIAADYESALFVSIHMNTFPLASCRGLQVWYSENHQDSKALADRVQGEVRQQLQPENNRKIKAATSSIYVLRHVSCPAVLIECGFLSNAVECEALAGEQTQKRLALVIACAIVNFKKMPNGTCAIS